MINSSCKNVDIILLRKVLQCVLYVNEHVKSPYKIAIFETLRSPARQATLFKNHYSKTMHSKHIPDLQGIGHAVDLVFQKNGEWTWDCPYWSILRDAKIKYGIRVISWDKPHCELA